ncbi:MAG: hypothetical protein HDT02_03585 [Bacteroidales bacterium]|nr:hypothetical protein [Bacteroidales bacterium]
MPIPAPTLEQLQEAAHSHRRDLLNIPRVGVESTTRFCQIRLGVRGKESVYTPDFDAELSGYSVAEREDVKGDGFIPRTLETFFGAAFFDFDPNQLISTIFGHRASQAGEGAKNTDLARDVVGAVLKNIGGKLNSHLFNAKQDSTKKGTKYLFNGWDTIVDAEIAAGNISAANGNYIKLTEKITSANADRILKSVLRQLSDELRETESYIVTSRSICDNYNENYLLTHQGLNYNKQFNQPVLEGSDGLFTFAPCVGKRKSKYIFFTAKGNMIIGFDQMSDKEHVEVNKYEPKKLTGELYMFVGCEFESIDPRRLVVVELADDDAADQNND